MEERPLELSDFGSEQEQEIASNPYRFLGLPQESGPEECRKSFITLSKRYHPDLVSPHMDVSGIGKLYTDEDVAGSGFPYKSIRMLTDAWNDKERKPEKTQQILSCIGTMSHQKMIRLNSAYAHIKALHDPQEWKKLFGYEMKTMFNEREGFDNKEILLEGDGEVTIYPNHYDYQVAGPHLSFDYGPCTWDPGENHWGYREMIAIKHLFAHAEVKDGKKISRILLEPLFDCFGLQGRKATRLLDMLSAKEKTEIVMKKFGIPDLSWSDTEDHDLWSYSDRFKGCINQINELSPFAGGRDEWYVMSMELNGGKLTLNGYTQSNFSEADYTLFLTLAYGPMLTK